MRARLLKMARNKLVISLLLFFVVEFSYSQQFLSSFRKDYQYLAATESFYKIHTFRKTWQDAKDICATEGATLFYPENQREANVVRRFWTVTQPFFRIFIGVSSRIVKEVFETVDGRSIYDVYANWAPGEPDDDGGNEDCVIMYRDGTLGAVSCNVKNPFVCKIALSSLEWDALCDMPNLDYTFVEALSKCYKFHKEPRTWSEAYAVCYAEQSYLAIVQSQDEAAYLSKLTAKTLRGNLQGNFLVGAVFLGFHKTNEGWKTIKGTHLVDSGYSKWAKKPDAGDNKSCGGMFYNGLLRDLSCHSRNYFICEHDLASLSISIDDTF